MAAAQKRIPKPAYVPQKAPSEPYARIAKTAQDPSSRELIEKFEIGIRSGRAWKVPKGCVCRLTTVEGPQVGDLNIWNFCNPREHFWAARTRQLHQNYVSVGDRLWSNLPYLRPLATIVGDSLSGYSDDVGGHVHDLLGTRCDPYVEKLISGDDFDFHCHSNLTRAIMPWGLSESDVHDVLNVFQVAGLNEKGQYFMESCPAKPGDYFEFFAEIDLLCAMSACPGGDLSAWGWGESSGSGNGEKSMLDCCRPLGVEIHHIADAKILEGWQSPLPAAYKGVHGLGFPKFQSGES